MTEGLESILELAKEARPRPNCVHVTVDVNDGRALKTERLIDRVANSLRKSVTYSLKLDTWADIYDVDQVMKIFVTKEDAKVRLRLRVIARASKAEQIVSTLCEPVRGPTEVLLAVIGDAIRALSDETQRQGPDNLTQRIARDRDNWQRRIQQSILDRIGFESELIFELDPQANNFPEISVRHFDVRAKDAPHRFVSVSMHVVLEPTEERAHDPLPRSQREREERIRYIAAEAFRDEITLHDCWFDRRKVESILARAMDRAFKSTAHRSRLVQLEPISPPVLREEKVACTIAWKGHAGRQIDFYVEAVLGLEPGGTGLFDSLHLKTRPEWLKDQAWRALEIAMHGKDFWDLALADQAEVGARVKSILRAAATETGQSVDLIVANVVLPENRWLDKQFLELSGGTFKTKNNLGLAEFDVALEIKFHTIRPLVDFVRHHGDLGQGANFNAAIEKAILDLVRKTAASVMSQVEHTEYFAKWEKWDDLVDATSLAQPGEPNYVHNRLVSAITNELRSRFTPALCLVRLRRVDKKVGEIISAIMALGPMTVDLNIRPENLSSDAQIIPTTVRFRPGVLDPSSVPDVIARGLDHFKFEAILDTLRSASRQFLDGLPAAAIRSMRKGLAAPIDPNDQRAMQTRLEQHVSRLMIDTYGFSIHVEDVEVGATREETLAFGVPGLGITAKQALLEQERQQIEMSLKEPDELRKLVKKLHEALQNNPLLTAEDRNRYDQDEKLLERAEAKIADHSERMRRTLGASVNSTLLLAAEVRRSGHDAADVGAAPNDATRSDDDIIDVTPRPSAGPDRL
ncbi:MAG: hypothetical protein HZA66_17605 [Rhodopseudomonas palustris]|uniref:Uncharacterized protein n=1 Tax=Rhodopseudomonas palustris TaxID=1076 RepID=A0A933VWQ6_RHOPL|nr:hypothetical protein [Rhodopseudomonas palustris]